MANVTLIERLSTLSSLADIPDAELEWLAAHGRLETYSAGAIVAPKGKRIEKLWIILSGRISVRVDRGAGPRRIIVWQSGEVSGMLPYSRMTGPPGDNCCELATELLTVHQDHFPQMVSRCPAFTAYAVHLMLDRARGFSASELQDEKMISLGRLAAGLAHEINNPASAIVRGAKVLRETLGTVDASWHALHAAGVNDELLHLIEETRSLCQSRRGDVDLSPIQRADREDEVTAWLERHDVDPALAAALVEAAATVETLERLAAAMSGPTLDAALRWVAAGCGADSIAMNIERAATRIYELVAAVKGFTYMDNLAAPESVDVEQGLRDSITVLTSKTAAKQATITLSIEAGIPRVRAAGGELNQVWFNLIDNALDAIPVSGHVAVGAHQEGDRVVVHVVDDGPGIPPDIVNRIFDPFFTTKPPGQGTGLGLDIVRRLLRRHRAEITVTAVPGRTDFRVSLLVDRPEPATVERPERTNQPPASEPGEHS